VPTFGQHKPRSNKPGKKFLFEVATSDGFFRILLVLFLLALLVWAYMVCLLNVNHIGILEAFICQ
jgi:hypothetical protein